MRRSSHRAVLCLLPLLFVSCNSDDLLNGINPENEAAAAVAGASTQILGPALDRLDLIQIFEDVPTKAALGVNCNAVEECASGTWQHCPNPKGFDYIFDACMLDGKMVSGTLSAAGSEVSGTVDFDISVGDRDYDGFVTFAQSGDCIVETLSQFTVRDSSLVSIIGGELTYCPGGGYPNGSLTVDLSGSSTFSLDAAFDGTPSAVISFDGGTGTIYNCTANLATGDATCQ